MSRKALPNAIGLFLTSLERGDDTAHRDAGLGRGLALSVVGVDEGERYRGADGIATLLGTSPVFAGATDWTIEYAMDSEVVIASARRDRVQLILDCGRISFLRVLRAEPAGALAA